MLHEYKYEGNERPRLCHVSKSKIEGHRWHFLKLNDNRTKRMNSGLLLLQNRRLKREGLKTNCREQGFDVFKERVCHFSLRSQAIGPSDSFGARSKVVLRDEGNA